MKKSIKKQMKQWRRPLKRKGLTHTVRKMKEGDPDAYRKGKSLLELEENRVSNKDEKEYYERNWDIYNPGEEYCSCCYGMHPDDYVTTIGFLSEIIKLPNNPFRENEKLKKQLLETDNSSKEKDLIKPSMLGEALKKHRDILNDMKVDDLNENVSYIREHAGSIRNIESVIDYAKKLNTESMAKAIMFFSPFWLRAPHSWHGTNKKYFIKHLFVRYEVPDFLYNEWWDDYENFRFKWLCWLIIIGQGGSLKNYAPFFQWNIPSKFQFHLQDLPSNLSPLEACLFAEVKRLGGNNTDAIRLLRSRAFVIDPTEVLDKVYFKFWQDTVRWLIRHRNVISDEEADIILDWAMHQYTESERAIREAEYNRGAERQMHEEQIILNNQQPDMANLQHFSMKGRSVQRVLEYSNEYLRQRSLPWSKYSWKNHGWDHAFDDPAYAGWEIVELTNGKELFLEGQDLGHCVSGYAGRCVANASAIFSLRQNKKRFITIEVRPSSKRIIQARGSHNRSSNKKENDIIAQWARLVLMR